MGLLAHLVNIDDPRHDINMQHEFLDILFLTVSAVLSGAEGRKDIKDFGDKKLEWLRQWLGNTTPAAYKTCITRFFIQLHPL